MVVDDLKRAPVSGAFTEAEYRTEPQKVVAHAIATGRAIVTRGDGTVRVVISIPPAECSAAAR